MTGPAGTVPYRNRFLARTRKYGWVVVEPATGGWTGYWTVPGKYCLTDELILERAPLPGDGWGSTRSATESASAADAASRVKKEAAA